MLNVWTMSTGGAYPDYYVQRLQAEVARHLDRPHFFYCISDHQIADIDTVDPPTDWPGWWGKIGLFQRGVTEPGSRNIWLDLDVVITGDLEALVPYTDEYFAAPLNWAQSGHGGVQSSVMCWRGGPGCQAQWIHDFFDPAVIRWPPVNAPGQLWGDQEWIQQLRSEGRIRFTAIDAGLVKSYKYHCRQGLPAGCRVVVFHGEPKPAAVREDWFSW